MTLAELIAPLARRGEIEGTNGRTDVAVAGVTDDSRRITPQCVFVAVKGERADGHAYVAQAAAAGAAAVIVEHAPASPLTIPIVRVSNSRRVLGELAAAAFDLPSTRLRMIGVTGTNGKTTTTYVTKGILEAVGKRVGLIGTVAYQIGATVMPAAHTTPGAVELQQLLARMVCEGLEAAVMEVSSHALALDRTAGCEYDVGVFTNLTQDHLDFHGSMEAYFEAKLRLFTGLGHPGHKMRKRAILNADDPRTPRIYEHCRVPVWTYSLRHPADLRASDIRLSASGTIFALDTPVGATVIHSRLVGEHNVANVLAAVGVALNEGVPLPAIAEAVRTVDNVPGRFERVEAGQDFTVVVDYAHTDDALRRLLATAQTLKQGRIITVFGCGGDRDRGKRPKMGRVAIEHSDVVFLTSDNPRTEDPMSILRDVEAGVVEALKSGTVQYRMVPDRREAIREAVEEAKPGDMVVIAGKGHEDYQILGTTKVHFDDREVAREAIVQRHR